MKRDVYRSEDLVVRLVLPPDAGTDTCFVTFDSFTNIETLDRHGFGQGFFEDRGIPAIHILSRRNLWYQEPDLPDALAAAAEAARPFDRVFAYGSSMGGYGAIRYGAAAGASVAIAISPQFTIDRRVMPAEIRWAAYSAATTFRNEAIAFPKVAKAYVFYDPRDLDRLHVERLSAEYDVEAIRLPYAGHPAGAYLAETGHLSRAVEEIRDGSFDPADLERRARAARGRSAQYLFTLSRLQPLTRLRLKLSLARMANAASPSDPEYCGYLGLLLAHMGRTEEAEGALREALSEGGDQPLALERYGRFLLSLGRVPEALDVLRRAVTVGAELQRVQRSYALALLADGDTRPALARLAPIFRRFPKLRRAVVADVVAVLGWRVGRRSRPRDDARPKGTPIRLNLEGDIRLRRAPPTRRSWLRLRPA